MIQFGTALSQSGLPDYADLLAWSSEGGVTGTTRARRLTRLARRNPAAAAGVLKRALALREAIQQTFVAIANGRRVARADLDVLNRELEEAAVRTRVAATATGFCLQCDTDADALDQLLWPVARATADLLTSADVQRIHQCAGDTCTYVFLDSTKNLRRCWCDMKVCGNRAKIRRFRARRKSATGVT